MIKSEHCVSVDNCKYKFAIAKGDSRIRVLRHGEPWIDDVNAPNAVHSLMCELDAARVVVQEVRRYVAANIGNLCPKDLFDALALHDSLTSDREPPSAWCGAKYAERQAQAERSVAESRAVYRAFKGIDDAPTIEHLDALWREMDASNIGDADRADAMRRYRDRRQQLIDAEVRQP